MNCGSINEPIYKTFETKNGAVRGIFHQKPYFQFIGIPFAKPPIGELRFKVIFCRNLYKRIQIKMIFKALEPIDLCKPQVLDAFECKTACSQIKFERTCISNEDCLHMNMFVPGDNKLCKVK